jgi:hypothetical protein
MSRSIEVSGYCKAFFPLVERGEKRETATRRWPLSFYLSIRRKPGED